MTVPPRYPRASTSKALAGIFPLSPANVVNTSVPCGPLPGGGMVTPTSTVSFHSSPILNNSWADDTEMQEYRKAVHRVRTAAAEAPSSSSNFHLPRTRPSVYAAHLGEPAQGPCNLSAAVATEPPQPARSSQAGSSSTSVAPVPHVPPMLSSSVAAAMPSREPDPAPIAVRVRRPPPTTPNDENATPSWAYPTPAPTDRWATAAGAAEPAKPQRPAPPTRSPVTPTPPQQQQQQSWSLPPAVFQRLGTPEGSEEKSSSGEQGGVVSPVSPSTDETVRTAVARSRGSEKQPRQRNRGRGKTSPQDAQLTARIVQYMSDPSVNPFQGSLPVERVQNFARSQLPDLYEQVVGYDHNSWRRYVGHHSSAYVLFTAENGKLRMRLPSHKNWRRGDELEHQHRNHSDDHILECLRSHLQAVAGLRCTVDQFIEAYPGLPQNAVAPAVELPMRGDLVRFIRRHPWLFSYNSTTFEIILKPATGSEHGASQ